MVINIRYGVIKNPYDQQSIKSGTAFVIDNAVNTNNEKVTTSV